jgi:hypothetical protein
MNAGVDPWQVRFCGISRIFLVAQILCTGNCETNIAGVPAMNMNLESQAVEALKETLQQVSVIHVQDIKIEPLGQLGRSRIVAHVDIYGHGHTLVCDLEKNADSPCVRKELFELRSLHTGRAGDAIPVLIAPSLSGEVQALCRDNDIGFLDLDGNAHLTLNEVFVASRSMSHFKRLPPQAESLPTSETAHFAGVA